MSNLAKCVETQAQTMTQKVCGKGRIQWETVGNMIVTNTGFLLWGKIFQDHMKEQWKNVLPCNEPKQSPHNTQVHENLSKTK